MARCLERLLESTHLTREQTGTRTQHIYKAVLTQSQYLDGGNFSVIHPDDLRRLFELYDEVFFQRLCAATLAESPIYFRLSRRMTQAGGRTTCFTPRNGVGKPHYEIAVSTTLLFHTFADVQRPIIVNGLPCRDRLEALQRIFEHELIHLAEMMVWTRSRCAAARFQSLAGRIFQHTDYCHQLVTPRERAMARFGVGPGDRVRFRIDGRQYVGMVNRITRRATVLVEDNRGTPYSDGKRYAKFYVPLGMLEKLTPGEI